MSYAKSLGREEEKRYAAALKNGSAVTYVDESGEAHKGMTAKAADEAGSYKDIYEAQLADNAAIAAGIAEQAAIEAENAEKALTEEYGATNKELYRQYRKALAELPQQLAAMGYTGGASESSRVALEQGYGEELGSNERARIAGVEDIRAAEAATVLQGQREADKADAEARREYQKALAELQERARKEELARAEALADTGDFSGYEKLGYSAEEIERLRTAWEAENPELSIAMAALSGSYSAEEVAAKPVSWVQQYLNALGYGLKVSGSWDGDTERAYRAVFGRGSGRYSTYSAPSVKEEKPEDKPAKKKNNERLVFL